MTMHTCGRGTEPANQARLERCAAFKSRYKGRAVGALGPDPQRAGYFVENEILVEHADRETAERIARDHGGTLIEPKAMLNAPDGMRRKRDVAVDGFPMPHLIRFDRLPARAPATSKISDLLGCEGHASSEMAAAVAAIVADHGRGSQRLGLNIIGDTLALPLQAAADQPDFGDPFGWPEYGGWAGVGPAWQLVESVRAIRNVASVTIGILDGGFWIDPAGQDFSGFAGVNLIDEGAPWNGANPTNAPVTASATGMAARWPAPLAPSWTASGGPPEAAGPWRCRSAFEPTSAPAR